MKEVLWATLAAVALTSRIGRPMTILLLALWFYSYAFVFFAQGEFGFRAATWLTLGAFALAVMLIRADGVTTATAAVTGLLFVSVGVQLVFWLVPDAPSRFGLILYYLGTALFTMQLGAMAADAVLRRLIVERRRRKRRTIGKA